MNKIGNKNIIKKMFGNKEIIKEVFNGSVIYSAGGGGSYDPILANNSWTDIQSAFASGVAADYWALGDTKTDLGTDNNTRTFRIVDLAGIHGKHGSFECVELIGNTLQWNSDTNIDDDECYNNYSISAMVSTHLPVIKGYLSSELQTALETSGQTTVKVAKNGINGTLLNVSGYLYLPAEKEWFASRTNSREEEFSSLTTFDYYLTHTTANYHIKYDTTNAARYYWGRSPYSGFTYPVCVVLNSGNSGSNSASGSSRVAPCFDF